MQIVIHTDNFLLTEDLRTRVKRRFQFVVTRFRDHVLCVSVSLSDINSPGGGLDKHCRVQLQLRGMAEIILGGHGSKSRWCYGSRCEENRANAGTCPKTAKGVNVINLSPLPLPVRYCHQITRNRN
jgi:ribosome-associated translation inhibitor RaiA